MTQHSRWWEVILSCMSWPGHVPAAWLAVPGHDPQAEHRDAERGYQN
jgi:hypothetical protein